MVSWGNLADRLEQWSSSRYAILGKAIRWWDAKHRIRTVRVFARAVFWGGDPNGCYGTITKDKGVIRNYGMIASGLDYVLSMDHVSGWKVVGTSNAEGHIVLIKDQWPNDTRDQGVAISGEGAIPALKYDGDSHVYFGTDGGHIGKMEDSSPWDITDLGVAITTDHWIRAMARSGDFIYFVTENTGAGDGHVGKIDTTDDSISDLGVGISGESRINCIAHDPDDDEMYFGTGEPGAPMKPYGRIGKVDVATDSITDLGVAIDGETAVCSMATVPDHRKLFFGTDHHAKVGKLNLDTDGMSEVGSPVKGAVNINGMDADTENNEVYFGTYPLGVLAKITNYGVRNL